MTSDQLAAGDNDLNPIDADGVPSSDSLLHLAIYKAKPNVNAVMHSLHATALGVAGRPPPLIVGEVVVHRGPSKSLNTGFPGTETLAQASVDAPCDRRAVLTPHHCMFAVAETVSEVVHVCALVERVAQVFINAESIDGAKEVPEESFQTERRTYLDTLRSWPVTHAPSNGDARDFGQCNHRYRPRRG